MLVDKLNDLWGEAVRVNDGFGDVVVDIETETREIELRREQRFVSTPGLLRRVSVTELTMSVETRAIIRRKRGGEPETSPWQPTGSKLPRFVEAAFDAVKDLPVLQGRLWKQSPSVWRVLARFMGGHQQVRECVLKDGHFMWWEPEAWRTGAEASGCLNFLLVRAHVEPDGGCESAFKIRPATTDGWEDSTCFTGGDYREFCFDVADDPHGVSRDGWVEKIRQHIDFGTRAGTQLGEGRVRRDVGVRRPKVSDLYLAIKRN